MKAFDKMIERGTRLFGSLEKAECHSGGTCTLERKFQTLSTMEMEQALRKGNAVILDARYGKHDDGFRIPGAKSLNEKSTRVEIEALLPDKAVKIITYCSNPECPASENLASRLSELGYLDIHEYPDGIEGWRRAGLKLEREES